MATTIRRGSVHEQSVSCHSCGWGEYDEGWAYTDADIRSQTARARRHADTAGHRVTILRTYAARVERVR